MHSYSIDNNVRGKFLIYIFIFSILVSTVLTALFSNVFQSILNWLISINGISVLLNECEKLGVTVNFIGVPFIYWILFYFFDKCIWKIPVIAKLHNVPDINGTWSGSLISSLNDKEIRMEMVVVQTWSKIKFISKFPDTNSKSESNNAAIYIESIGDMKVGFGFVNRSRQVNAQQYDGYNVLEFDDENHIVGRYFNNRDNTNYDPSNKGGNKGIFYLKKEQK